MRPVLTALLAIGVSSAEAQTYGGYDCTEDCSGHRAGYEWAQENNISDSSECDSNSNSFTEGCQLYTEDPDRDSEYDDDGNEVPES